MPAKASTVFDLPELHQICQDEARATRKASTKPHIGRSPAACFGCKRMHASVLNQVEQETHCFKYAVSSIVSPPGDEEELPDGWACSIDEKTNRPYYWMAALPTL